MHKRGVFILGSFSFHQLLFSYISKVTVLKLKWRCGKSNSWCYHVSAARGVQQHRSCSFAPSTFSPWNSPGQKSTGVGNLSLSRGSSQPRDWTQVSHIAGGFFTSWATREAQHGFNSFKNTFTEPLLHVGIGECLGQRNENSTVWR